MWLLMRAAGTLPPCYMRTDLHRRIGWWAEEWHRDLQRRDELRQDIERTTASWQTSPGRKKKSFAA